MPSLARAASLPAIDQRVFLHGVSWAQYEALLELRGEAAGPRMTYLQGELELTSPSPDHEAIKTTIARLLEVYALATGIELEGYGSMTMKSRPQSRGAEPDECYSVGSAKKHPDLAIEVVWTSGGIEMLDVYRGLKVREVWIHRSGKLEVYTLRRGAYVRIPKSQVLPKLDLDELMSYVGGPSQSEAVRKYYRALQKRL